MIHACGVVLGGHSLSSGKKRWVQKEGEGKGEREVVITALTHRERERSGFRTRLTLFYVFLIAGKFLKKTSNSF